MYPTVHPNAKVINCAQQQPFPGYREVTKLPDPKPTQIRLQIDTRDPFADSTSFGSVGPYERIVGKVHFAVNPDSPAYTPVVDIQYAPRNPKGLVEFSTDFFILKPVDLSRSNRRLIYDVNNRGTKLLIHFLNDAPQVDDPATPQDAGNGFLMRRGYTVLWSGWQGDLLPWRRPLGHDACP